MAYSVNTLTAYVEQNKGGLLYASVLGGKTTKYATIQSGVKYQEALNIIANTVYLTLGHNCTYTTSGTTTLTQRTISVCELKSDQTLCIPDLNKYWAQKELNPGSVNDSIPFEAVYATELAAEIGQWNDKLIWAGNTSTGSGNLSLCNGLKQKLTLTTDSASTVNMGTSAVTSATVIAIVDGMVANIPQDALELNDLVCFCSYSFFNTYYTAIRTANLYNVPAESTAYEMNLPTAVPVRLVATVGLTSQNFAILTPSSNLYIGTDLMSETDSFNVLFNPYTQAVQTMVRYKLGVQVAFPQFVVVQNLS
jgi:hypothetical protein